VLSVIRSCCNTQYRTKLGRLRSGAIPLGIVDAARQRCEGLSTLGIGFVAKSQGAAPPRQPELAPSSAAEFVICDHTIEFLFRDSKQFTGLLDCQARAAAALDFHFNASLATLNLVRAEDLGMQPGQEPHVFSMASWKQCQFNERLLDVFMEHLALDPTWVKNHACYEKLRAYGAIAA
jgi:hypothetical protein